MKAGAIMLLVMLGHVSSGFSQETGVLGPGSSTFETLFKQAGVPATGIRFNADYGQYKVIVVTPNAVRDNNSPFHENADRLKKYVKDGGFLLVLHQNDSHWHDKWLPYPCKMTNDINPVEKIRKKGHLLFEGLKETDLGAANNGVKVFDSFSEIAPQWEVLASNHSVDGKRELVSTIECAYGKGRVLISGYDPYVNLNKMRKVDLNKLRLIFNGIRYAFVTVKVDFKPDLKVFERRLAQTSIPIPAVQLKNSKFGEIDVHPTGRLGEAHYRGAVASASSKAGSSTQDQDARQTRQVRCDAFVIHWREAGRRRLAGIHPGVRRGDFRVYTEIEIPATLLDERTAYSSLLTLEKDVRIESVAAVSVEGKFIIREVIVTNLGRKTMEQVKVHEFANLPFMQSVRGYGHGIIHAPKKNMLLISPHRLDKNGPLVYQEVCALAGIKKAVAHSIERGGVWGQNELLYSRSEGRLMGRLITGESNNIEKGYEPAGILVFPLGNLEPGKSGSAAAVIAVGDNPQDLDKELSEAKMMYASAAPLTGKADRKALIEKYARLNWKAATHDRTGEFINPVDPDGDGWNAAREAAEGTNPLKEDTDGDGIMDYLDPDPTKPEPLIATVTEKEIANDTIIGISKREIIRGVRDHLGWVDATDPKRLTRHIAKLRNLRVNCIAQRIGYLGVNKDGVIYGNGDTYGYKSKRYGDRDILAEYIAALHREDIDVRIEGLYGYNAGGELSMLEWLDKPGGKTCYLPGTSCCNGWIKGVIGAMIFDLAVYPVEFISLNEERYNRSYSRERFQTNICMCPLCAHRFKQEMGYELPGLRGKEATDRKMFQLHRWRKRISTEAWRYWNKMAVTRNPEIKFMQQSTRNALRLGGKYKDFAWGGLSAEDIGYKAGMYYGGDHTYYPYWYREEYAFNHFYYPGVMKLAVGTTPQRKGWVEYGGPFRAYFEPIWCYGQMISPIAAGGKGVDFFRFDQLRLLDMEKLDGPKSAWKISSSDVFEYLKLAYVTLDELNDWLFPAKPPRQIAFLYDTAADEVYSVLKGAQKHAVSDPNITHLSFMMYLFRTGYPFDVHYLHYADYKALKDYPVIVLPSALAVAEDRIPILKQLVKNGASLVVIGEYGQLDYDGRPYEKPALLELAGIKQITSAEFVIDSLTTLGILAGVDTGNMEFRARRNVIPAPGTVTLGKMGGDDRGIYHRKLGKGQVIFMPGNFVATSTHPDALVRPTSRKSKDWDITHGGTKLMNAVLDHCLGKRKAITRYDRIAPDANADTELVLLENGPKDKVLFAFNWEASAKSVIGAGLKLPKGKYRIEEWSMKPTDKTRIEEMKIMPFVLDGKKVFTAEDLGNFRIELEPQQIRILHIEG